MKLNELIGLLTFLCLLGTLVIQDWQIDDLQRRTRALERDPTCQHARAALDTVNAQREARQ